MKNYTLIRNDYSLYCIQSAEFIDENTLAVSMHKDGDDRAYLWKVGIDGKL